MPRHFTASLHQDTASAIAQNTDHVTTGYYFFKWLKGVQVGDKLVPMKVVLDGEYAKRQGCDGKVIKITDQGFFDEDEKPFDIWTINLVLGDAGFKFGVRFKFETKTENGVRMYVN